MFPEVSKFAEVSPTFKKNDSLSKEKYRPVSILSHVSKAYEWLMCKQLVDFMKGKLSPLLTGFRKNDSTQHSLVNMVEEWKKKLDNDKIIGSILIIGQEW